MNVRTDIQTAVILMFIVTGIASTACADLVAHWDFNTVQTTSADRNGPEYLDSSGNGHHADELGTMYNAFGTTSDPVNKSASMHSTLTPVSPDYGGYYDFRDGEVDYEEGGGYSLDNNRAAITSLDSFTLTANAGLTLAAWVNPQGSGGGPRCPWSNNQGRYSYIIGFGEHGDNPLATLAIGSADDSTALVYGHIEGAGSPDAQVIVRSTVAIPLDTWTHVAITYDRTNDEAKVYIGGELNNTMDISVVNDGELAFGDAHLGAREDDMADHDIFLGSMDDVRVYSDVLNATEIADLAAVGIMVSALVPSDDATVATPQSLTVSFNKDIMTNTIGAITITNMTTGTTDIIPVGSAELVVSGADLVITPTSPALSNHTDYAVLIETNAIKDLDGTFFAGITNASTWNFTTATKEYRNVVLADNPLIYYELDEASGTTAVNSGSSGATHHGTIGGVVTLGQSSFAYGGTAYDFGGGWITAAGAPFPLTNWSVEAWINWDPAKSSASHVFGNDISGWNDDVLLGIGVETGAAGVPAGHVGCVQQGNPGTTRDAVADQLSHSAWHHVVATGSEIAGELRLYVDGVLVDTNSSLTNGVTLNGSGGIGSPSLFVGKDGYADRTFDGLIDEFALYDTVLDAATILTHYRAGVVCAVELSNTTVVSNAAPGTLVGTLSDPSGAATSFVLTNAPAGGSAADNSKFQITDGTNLLTGVVMTQQVNYVSIAGVSNGIALVTNSFEIALTRPSLNGLWYRGNTHTHTTESDGDSSPEVVTAWYHDAGYNFLTLTDHNKLVDPATVTLPDPCRDDFILIPGDEVSGSKYVHTTAMNIDTLVPWDFDHDDVSKIVQNHVDGVRHAHGLPILNHPNFVYAVTADDMLAVPNLHLFELINGHPSVNNHGDASHVSTEELWDDMLSHGKRIYAVAADDTHHLQTIGPSRANPGRGWIMVDADALTPEAITQSVEEGRFYASNGVFLNRCEASRTNFAIEVDITATLEEISGAPAHGKVITDGTPGWTISFIGPGGSVLHAVVGTQATFTPTGEHDYVRARATYRVEDGAGVLREYAAWGQPVFFRPDWTPAQIGGKLAAWFDAADASTVTTNAGGFVSAWNDKSGKARHAAQGTSAKQPVYSSAALNAMHVVTFDGGDDWLRTLSFSQSQPVTYLFVCKSNTSGGGAGDRSYVFDGVSANQDRNLVALYGNNTGTVSFWAKNWVDSTVSMTTEPFLITATFDTTNSLLTIDDNAPVMSDAGEYAIRQGLTLGANYLSNQDFLDGYIAELVMIANATPDDIERTEGYLAWKWSLVANLPADHAYKNAPPQPTGAVMIIR